ncbi:MAG: hypothetical protein H8E53_10320 [Planctomycetes bacterium]|nr:hypothetical protein [Planctomycetota bacterium]
MKNASAGLKRLLLGAMAIALVGALIQMAKDQQALEQSVQTLKSRISGWYPRYPASQGTDMPPIDPNDPCRLV